jgi:hypothetical protein
MINSGRTPAGSLRIVARAVRLKEVTGPAASPMLCAASSRVAPGGAHVDVRSAVGRWEAVGVHLGPVDAYGNRGHRALEHPG